MEYESLEPPAAVSAEERPAQVPESSSSTSDNSDEDFERPRYHRKKQPSRIVRCKRLDDQIQGAPVASGILLVFRVQKFTSDNSLKSYLKEISVDVCSLLCVSHEDTKYRSLTLEVSKDDHNKLFAEDAWSNGTCVNCYIYKNTDVQV